MSGSALFVWILLGVAAVVLVGITVYVDSWRRRPRRGPRDSQGNGPSAGQDDPGDDL
jgi:hypothetical protein